MTRLYILLILFAFLAAGCHQQNKKERPLKATENPSEDHQESKSFTVYTDHLELFVEMENLVVGKETSLNAHFTIIQNDHSPLTNATITVQLIDGNEIIQEAAGIQRVPGIYKIQIIPARPLVVDLLFIVSANDIYDREGNNGYFS